jgi:ABC-type sugar transport system ATPase subunit
MAALRLDLSVALRTFRLQLALETERETVAIVGPSGAGKSTVLRAVAGLVKAAGTVEVNGRDWSSLAPERRSVGFVFQDYALFPHLSVRGNVAFGGPPGDVLERLGIEHLAHARPREISGGERQRVALARALARRPEVLLLDEPLAALDPHTRDTVRVELRATLRELGLPTLVVTHDFVDAAALAERVGAAHLHHPSVDEHAVRGPICRRQRAARAGAPPRNADQRRAERSDGRHLHGRCAG